jgi:TRAP-type C4-dicarboxylate transport system substrate-binding protein
MTKMNRRQVLAQGAAIISAPALVMPKYANAAEYNFKFGTNVPITHPLNVRAIEASERILKETNGQVQINYFQITSLVTMRICCHNCGPVD